MAAASDSAKRAIQNELQLLCSVCRKAAATVRLRRGQRGSWTFSCADARCEAIACRRVESQESKGVLVRSENVKGYSQWGRERR